MLIIQACEIIFIFVLMCFPAHYPLVFRFVCTAMKRGSGGGPYLAEVYLDLITIGAKGTVSDVCLTGSAQRD